MTQQRAGYLCRPAPDPHLRHGSKSAPTCLQANAPNPLRVAAWSVLYSES